MSSDGKVVTLILERSKRGFVIEPSVSVTVSIRNQNPIPFLDYFFAAPPQFVLSVNVAMQDSSGQIRTHSDAFCCNSVEDACKRISWEKTRRLGNGVFVVMDYTVKPGESSYFDHVK